MKLRITSTIKNIKPLIKGRCILDIGNKGIAHKGTMANELHKLAANYTGIDEEENAEKFNLNKKFEVVTCFEVLEHLENPGLALEQIKKHLMFCGDFICSVPNIKSPYHLIVPQTRWHLNCWDEKTFKQRLEKYFTFVEIKRINFGRTLLAKCR